ncbi:putative E3 ubiquitin-protein ligase ZNRF2 [Cladorrhinum sp. PSN259]|nr:putative E3 ubiquitin-protein ligase ZNRF2 [Cladorrhinum sp. PSN259]
MDSGAGGQRQRLIELSSDSDSASNASSSSGGSDVSARGTSSICQWRTAMFHDQECSRYFDCPSHTVDRVLSDAGDAESQDGEQQQDMSIEDAEDRPDPGAVSPLSEDGDLEAGDGGQRPRSPSPELPTTASENGQASEVRPSGRQPTRPDESAENPIVLGGSSPLQSRQEIEPQSNATSSRSAGISLPTQASNGQLNFTQQRELPQAGSVQHHNHLALPSQGQQPPASGATNIAAPTEIVLPRWQPDAEATYCFICHTQFSIFVRKHHCRKCGRVVCAACSPHRITIPYQYIVQPPGVSNSGFMSRGIVPPSPSGYPSFGGGASVRLCNPCVPDPNTTPPQAQAIVQSNVSSPAPYFGLGSYFGASPSDASSAHARSRSVTMVGNWATSLSTCLPLPLSRDAEFQPQPQQAGVPSSSRNPRQQYPQSTEGRILSGTPPVYYPSTSAPRRPRPYQGAAPYPSMPDFSNRGGSSSVAGPSSSSHTHRRLPPLPAAPPQIAEEDECPVCHRELPPRSLPDFEARREAHINMCITSHSAYGAGGPASSPGTPGENPLPPTPPRRTGMFPYKATEKDCVDSAECTICLEEFEVGVPMARLECLCRFHRACIAAWWERHPGRCPMHQHDGFGY